MWKVYRKRGLYAADFANVSVEPPEPKPRQNKRKTLYTTIAYTSNQDHRLKAVRKSTENAQPSIKSKQPREGHIKLPGTGHVSH